MASCPKCGKKIKAKRQSSGIYECKRHGPVRKLEHKPAIEEQENDQA